jgi:DNA mismatch repair ATPase MutS
MDSIHLKLQKCSTRPNDFLVLIKTISAALSISATLGNDIFPRLQQDENHDYWSRLLQRCHASVLLHLQDRMAAVIDEEAMLEFGASSGVVIRRGFHPQLDEWKDQYEDLDGV